MDLLQAILKAENKETKAFLIELMEARQTIKVLKNNITYIGDFAKRSTEEINNQDGSLDRALIHVNNEK